jgi:hypothetical protein
LLLDATICEKRGEIRWACQIAFADDFRRLLRDQASIWPTQDTAERGSCHRAMGQLMEAMARSERGRDLAVRTLEELAGRHDRGATVGPAEVSVRAWAEGNGP